MAILKVTKDQGFALSYEDTFFDLQFGRHFDTANILRLK